MNETGLGDGANRRRCEGGLGSPRVILWWDTKALPTPCGTCGHSVGQVDSARSSCWSVAVAWGLGLGRLVQPLEVLGRCHSTNLLGWLWPEQVKPAPCPHPLPPGFLGCG